MKRRAPSKGAAFHIHSLISPGSTGEVVPFS